MTLRCKIRKVKKTKGGFLVTMKCPSSPNVKRGDYIQSLKETNIQLD